MKKNIWNKQWWKSFKIESRAIGEVCASNFSPPTGLRCCLTTFFSFSRFLVMEYTLNWALSFGQIVNFAPRKNGIFKISEIVLYCRRCIIHDRKQRPLGNLRLRITNFVAFIHWYEHAKMNITLILLTDEICIILYSMFADKLFNK